MIKMLGLVIIGLTSHEQQLLAEILQRKEQILREIQASLCMKFVSISLSGIADYQREVWNGT